MFLSLTDAVISVSFGNVHVRSVPVLVLNGEHTIDTLFIQASCKLCSLEIFVYLSD